MKKLCNFLIVAVIFFMWGDIETVYADRGNTDLGIKFTVSELGREEVLPPIYADGPKPSENLKGIFPYTGEIVTSYIFSLMGLFLIIILIGIIAIRKAYYEFEDRLCL